MAPSMKPEDMAGSLLSPSAYDDDAASANSEQDTDSEDDQVLREARTSKELRDHDRGILLEEEERIEMLPAGGNSRIITIPGALKQAIAKAYDSLPPKHKQNHTNDDDAGSGKRERRRQRRARRKEKTTRLKDAAVKGEDRELMFEMEEGGMKDGSSTGESSETEGSFDADKRRLRLFGDQKSNRRRKWITWCLILLVIALLFTGLLNVAWRLSTGRKHIPDQPIFNNGTALFGPTTILISLDGFRADFLNRGITPRLNAFIAEGISPRHMLPSFPSVTFPNHYTLVTGLYPESHGVVGNTFWDPELELEFYYTDPLRSLQEKWWGGEPLWATAEKQGIRSAIHMWPGSEAHIVGVEPSFMDPYNGKELLSKKVDRILGLIDMPGQEDPHAHISDMRPQFIAAYVPNVDSDGHKFGPNSTEIRTTINNVDKMLDHLFAGLEERNLTQVVNVVIVSDHGMATTSTDRLIQLDDIIDMNMIAHSDGWPLYGLRPKDLADLQGLYDKLSSEAAKNPGFEVYLRDINMPERYHFSKNERIAPLWIVPTTGWAIVQREEFDIQKEKARGGVYHPRGLHGYDHEHPLMRAIFVARGPAFPHAPNSRVDVFRRFNRL
jgi:predicted AlkP superfamily pyrophosphatase or phosphodiesterase